MSKEIIKPAENEVIESTKMSKGALNVIKTTMRNNVDLTSIADNKANILLTLSSLIFTFLIPSVLGNMEIIIEEHLYIPLILLSATCLISIVMAALSTRPMKLDGQAFDFSGKQQFSPFFFGNYYKISEAEYKRYVRDKLINPALMKEYIMSDMYHLGRGLGVKYSRIRKTYNVFIGGIIISAITGIIVVIFF